MPSVKKKGVVFMKENKKFNQKGPRFNKSAGRNLTLSQPPETSEEEFARRTIKYS